ncbi:MAG: hypothetical protein FJ125_11735, partial [Deltaproteobacteria bacterium]|nr:hypothetical protein [Deltaproteobacteria bacterium]
WLEGVAGVLLGDFSGCDDAGSRALDVLGELCGRWLPGVPVLAGLPVGHGPRNHPLRLGCRLLLDADTGVLSSVAETALEPGPGSGREDAGAAG